MGNDVVRFEDLDGTDVGLVGGKGANLGALSKVDGVRVPPGFCVTTDAYRRAVASLPSLGGLLDRVAHVDASDGEAIGAASAEIRRLIEAVAVPDDVAAEVGRELARLGADVTFAVRSSATAEDLPTASFAGQQDSYLDVDGLPAVLDRVTRCWASLFTERAVTYRLRNGIDHRKVAMAVVVQQLVPADAAGVLFTADPLTGNRTVASIEATYGLGEALVSGLVDADRYEVRDGEIVTAAIGAKELAIRPGFAGGTREVEVEPELRERAVLTDAQVVRLAGLGRRIEASFGRPQDIEWCLLDDDVFVVQSRPITTVFPVPDAGDDEPHVYISVGHQQMMTDAMKPLGVSFWQMTTPRPMAVAGDRLFVDVTQLLAVPAGREGLLQSLGRSDPLIGDALQTVIDRGFVPPAPEGATVVMPPGAAPPSTEPIPVDTDPGIVTELIERSRASLDEARNRVHARSGTALLDAISEDIEELRRVLHDPRSRDVIMAGMEAAWWLNDQLQAWLGEKDAADVLAQSVPNNVTAEMGLALLDVADVIRPHPEVVAVLEHAERVGDDDFLDRLDDLDGGPEARHAIDAFLDRYGMRCVGEIDLTRPRWRERPTALVPVILANVEQFERGAGEERFERGRREAEQKERDVLERVRALPDGERKADEVKRMIDRVRTCAGFREHPKYWMIARYLVYKQALLDEARRLVAAGVLRDEEDIFFLTFAELREVVGGKPVDDELVQQRRDDHRWFEALTPPRVLTSEGEAVAGSYRRDDVPDGALVGLAVSAGTVEGRARVVHDMGEAELEPGDILVTAYTDPSWSPLFVSIAGLVTEVGGLMTHGSVIAREYGLPAVVGVQQATTRIRDGQPIRVHGTEGYVELLP